MGKPCKNFNILRLPCLLFALFVQSQAQLMSIAQQVPALFVFGDSIVDSGNKLNTLVNASYLPYGCDFAFSPSGRFTNGETMMDMLGTSLNLTLSIPLWVAEVDKNATTMGGFNYASALAGILPETGSAWGQNMSMQNQIALFRKTLENYLSRHLKNEELSEYMSNSVFAISVGSNDYLYNYLRPLYYNNSLLYDIDKFGDNLVQQLGKRLMDLYDLGARKMMVFELGPIGCFPLVMKEDDSNGRCLEALNTMVTMFNGKLSYKLMEVGSSLEGTAFFLVQTFKLIYDMMENPSGYGFKDTTNPCCTVEGGGATLCTPNMRPCEERHSTLFWDKFHLTEAAYRIVVGKCLNESSICTPLSSMKPGGEVESGQSGRRPKAIFCGFTTLFSTIMISIAYL